MSKKAQTQTTILDQAVQIASLEGLEGLSIGKLAETLHMSKSGVFAHFGSKTDLQMATLDHAWGIMAGYLPTTPSTNALQNLQNFLDGWLLYLEQSPFAGGCVFMAASTEFDGRAGQVREHLLSLVNQAILHLHERISKAQNAGQLGHKISVPQMAFELHALLQAANNAFQLTGDKVYFEFARNAVMQRLELWRGA